MKGYANYLLELGWYANEFRIIGGNFELACEIAKEFAPRSPMSILAIVNHCKYLHCAGVPESDWRAAVERLTG